MEIIRKIAKLIDVKSIVTLILTVVFAYLSIKQLISSEQFVTIFSTVIAFYFGCQVTKASNNTTDSKKAENEPLNESED